MRNSRRSQRGAALVAGVACVTLLIGITAMLALILINSGSGLLLSEKIQRANNLAAQFAAGHSSDSNVQEETTEYAKSVLISMGIAPEAVAVTLEPVQSGNGPGVSVTLSNQFHFVGIPLATMRSTCIASLTTEM